jgi:hypothetical protein
MPLGPAQPAAETLLTDTYALAILRRMMSRIGTLFVVALGIVGAGRSAWASPVEDLKALEGKWKCEGKRMEGGEEPLSATVEIKRELEGAWYLVRYEQKKTKSNPTPFVGMAFWGYDQMAKQFLSMWVESSGGRVNATSTGWQGDIWTWTGEISKDKKSRDVITKKSAKEISVRSEVSAKPGEWTAATEMTCKK